MFLRKLTVILLPLLLCAVLCLLFPLLGGLGFFANVLGGILLGVSLALLLPLSGASRRMEPFGGLLWVPGVLLVAVVVCQYLQVIGKVDAPLLNLFATTHGQVVLVECAFAAYMLTEAIRTHLPRKS